MRPLKGQLDNFSESNKTQIESNARIEFERDKLQRTLLELQNDHESVRSDLKELIVHRKFDGIEKRAIDCVLTENEQLNTKEFWDEIGKLN